MINLYWVYNLAFVQNTSSIMAQES